MKSMRKKKSTKYSVDSLATRLWRSLLRDFRKIHGEGFGVTAENAFNAGIKTYRDFNYPNVDGSSVDLFKAEKQMEALLKKFRYKQDYYTDDELDMVTYKKFFSDQERIATQPPRTETSFRVLQEARKIAKSILGPLPSASEIAEKCRFGRKSSIGCPLDLAYIDVKLTDVRAFTGTKECTKWFFQNVVEQDSVLKELVSAILSRGKPDLEHPSLNLINVPKTWKVHRDITPLTLIALFYSYGIGLHVTDCLAENADLDIRRLQRRHQSLVRGFSRSRSHVTADLTAASNSLVSWLLNQILPREWYNAIKLTFVRQLVAGPNESLHYTETILPMGNGLTFPVETLVFYAVIKAIGNLTGIEGIYSVYGDDLIYPREAHKYVVHVFPSLNFKLNLEKTFVSSSFRESCGSDYYRGCDVRPFFLKEESHALTRTKYAAFLYKTYNGLALRWDLDVLPETRWLLLEELSRLGLPVLRVPFSYPDHSGIRCRSPRDIWRMGSREWWVPWHPVTYVLKNGSWEWSFSYLQYEPSRRVVLTEKPYYWLALQGLDDEPDEIDFWNVDTSVLNEFPTGGVLRRLKTGVKTVWRKRKDGSVRKIHRAVFEPTCTSRRYGAFVLKAISDLSDKDGVQLSHWS